VLQLQVSSRSGCMPPLRENVVPSVRALVIERASVDSTYPKTCSSGSGTSLFLVVSGLIEQAITTFFLKTQVPLLNCAQASFLEK
jgi:hypothetical protein